MAQRLAILAMAAAMALSVSACGSSHGQTRTGGGSGGGGGSAGGGGVARCGPSGARTLAASSGARVYASGPAVYGCTPGSAPRLLGRRAAGCLGTGRIGAVAAAGSLVAYSTQHCGVDTGTTVVTVRRLTGGAVLSSDPAITRAVAVEAFQSVSALVLRSDGAVAWISELGSVIAHRHLAELHRRDGHGFALLDSGPGGSLVGLRLTGSTVSWTHAGANRSAPIG